LQPVLGMLGKVRCCFLFLSQISKNPRKEKKKQNQTKEDERGEPGDFMHGVAEAVGHRWGGSPSHRGGAAGRRWGAATPARPPHKASRRGARPWRRWPWKPFGTAAGQKPYGIASLGPAAGCWGCWGSSSGKEASRPAEGPSRHGCSLPLPGVTLLRKSPTAACGFLG